MKEPWLLRALRLRYLVLFALGVAGAIGQARRADWASIGTLGVIAFVALGLVMLGTCILALRGLEHLRERTQRTQQLKPDQTTEGKAASEVVRTSPRHKLRRVAYLASAAAVVAYMVWGSLPQNQPVTLEVSGSHVDLSADNRKQATWTVTNQSSSAVIPTCALTFGNASFGRDDMSAWNTNFQGQGPLQPGTQQTISVVSGPVVVQELNNGLVSVLRGSPTDVGVTCTGHKV